MAGDYSLRVTDGSANGSVLDADQTLVLGRKEIGAGSLGGDPQLSSRHAQVYTHQGSLLVHDLGSTNGTFVNGRRISEPTYLNPGDRLIVGSTTLEVQNGGTVMGAPIPASDGHTQMGTAPTSVLPPAPPPPPPPAKNNNALYAAIAGGAVLLAGVIVALVLVLSGGDDEDKNETTASTPTTTSTAARTTPQTTPAPAPAPAPAGDTGNVDPQNVQNIQNVINDFQSDVVGGDIDGACENVTSDFSTNGGPTDCKLWAPANVNDAPIEFNSFAAENDPKIVVVNLATNGQVFTVAMDGTSGTWLIDDISPAGGE